VSNKLGAIQTVDLKLLGLHLPETWKHLLGISLQLLQPTPQHVVIDIKITRRLHNRNATSLTRLTASSLNSRLNFLLSTI
jgi:hypothetical protein